MKKQVAILISGRGSNMRALLDYSMNEGREVFSVSVVVSNRSNAPGLDIARKYGVETQVCKSEAEILEVLRNKKVELICLAGFMKILSADFISSAGCNIINIHPSLLPSFKGLNAQAEALSAGVKIAGCTVHYVTPEVDAGEIIVQGAVSIVEGDTVESLSARILQVEHKCFPLAVKIAITGLPNERSIFLLDER